MCYIALYRIGGSGGACALFITKFRLEDSVGLRSERPLGVCLLSLSLIVAILLFASGVKAQQAAGSITGTVSDAMARRTRCGRHGA